MDILAMTKKDFESVPKISKENKPKTFRSVVILPSIEKHDSGFKIMDFVLCDDYNEPICRIAMAHDVIDLDGIGGYGDRRGKSSSNNLDPKGWCIDCLPCGYLRIFAKKELHITYEPISTLELFCD